LPASNPLKARSCYAVMKHMERKNTKTLIEIPVLPAAVWKKGRKAKSGQNWIAPWESPHPRGKTTGHEIAELKKKDGRVEIKLHKIGGGNVRSYLDQKNTKPSTPG